MKVDHRITAVAIRVAAAARADFSNEADCGPAPLQRINHAIKELQAALAELQPLLTLRVVPPRAEAIKQLGLKPNAKPPVRTSSRMGGSGVV